MKPMHRSKTIWCSLAIAVLGVLYDNLTYVQNLIPEKYYGIVLIAIGVIMAVLRVTTTQAIGEDFVSTDDH